LHVGIWKKQPRSRSLGTKQRGIYHKNSRPCGCFGSPDFILTLGQRNDITQAEALTEKISHATVIADKGYDSQGFIDRIQAKVCIAVMPAKRNRKIQRLYDEHTYKERHLIACFFGKIKHFRRIF
jgi:transposase